MRVDDEDWQRCFGTADSQIEPIPKLGKVKPTRAQLASKMILDGARLRDAAHRKRTLFDSIDESPRPNVQQARR